MFLSLLSWNFMQYAQQPHVVNVILQAKKDHIEEVKAALLAVVAPSRNESTNLQYHLIESADDSGIFALYEHWTSATDHAKQFEKKYIQELMNQLEGKLEKPYEACIGREINPS